PRILTSLGYRRVLLVNTVALGVLIAHFVTIGVGTPVWIIVIQGAALGFLSALQYTSMNTLAYADVSGVETSMASTIASTFQQMPMSFGVATASIVTAVVIGDRPHDAAQMIRGIHGAFVVLGAMTVLSALVFRELGPNDGANVSRHHEEV